MITRKVKSKNLFYDIYLPKTFNKRGIIYCPGLPGFPHKSLYAQKWVEEGFVFLEPRYLGTWESKGKFSPENCLKSVKEAVKFFKKGRIKELRRGTVLKWDINEIIFLANSFGGAVALSAMPTFKKIKRAILLSPITDISGWSKSLKFFGKEDEFFHFLKAGFPNIYRGLSLRAWQKFLRGENALNPLKYLQQLTEKKLFFIHGTRDQVVPIKTIKKFLKELKKLGASDITLKTLSTDEHGSGFELLCANLAIQWAKRQ